MGFQLVHVSTQKPTQSQRWASLTETFGVFAKCEVPMAQTLASFMDSHLSMKSNKPGMAEDKEIKQINTNPLYNMFVAVVVYFD